MHKVGYSFTYLAFTSYKQFRTQGYVAHWLPYFHLKELYIIKNQIKVLIPEALQYLSQLSEGQLIQVMASVGKSELKPFLTKKWLFFPFIEPGLLPSSPPHYFYNVYERAQLDKVMESSPYRLFRKTPYSRCGYSFGEMCWQYSGRYLFNMLGVTSFIIFGILLLVFILLVRFVLVTIKKDRLETEKKRLALRVLSHEFRTPITGLLLDAEPLQKEISQLSQKGQGSLLRVLDNIYRLKRLTDLSQRYLRVTESQSPLEVQKEKIASLNHFIRNILDSYDQSALHWKPKGDRSLYSDPYWLDMCLRNLMENAFTHGKPPVRIDVSIVGKGVSIKIFDAGGIGKGGLTDFIQPFAKSHESRGMGLGLNIVYHVMESLGGKLRMSQDPKYFELLFKGVVCEENSFSGR